MINLRFRQIWLDFGFKSSRERSFYSWESLYNILLCVLLKYNSFLLDNFL